MSCLCTVVPEAVVDGRPLLYSASLGRIFSKNGVGWLRRKSEVAMTGWSEKCGNYAHVLIKSPTSGTFSNFGTFVLQFVSSQLPHTSYTEPLPQTGEIWHRLTAAFGEPSPADERPCGCLHWKGLCRGLSFPACLCISRPCGGWS